MNFEKPPPLPPSWTFAACESFASENPPVKFP